MANQNEELLTENKVPVMMPTSLLQAVDDYRFSNRLPSRGAAVRALVEIALKSQNAKRPKNPS